MSPDTDRVRELTYLRLLTSQWYASQTTRFRAFYSLSFADLFGLFSKSETHVSIEEEILIKEFTEEIHTDSIKKYEGIKHF